MIDNPRQDASEIFEAVKMVLHGDLAKKQAEIIKVMGALFNNLLLMRRNMYAEKIMPIKGARTMIKRLLPDGKFLFGGKKGEITKAIKNSQEVNTLNDYINYFN